MITRFFEPMAEAEELDVAIRQSLEGVSYGE